jgi:hypothetical protein
MLGCFPVAVRKASQGHGFVKHLIRIPSRTFLIQVLFSTSVTERAIFMSVLANIRYPSQEPLAISQRVDALYPI